MLTPEQEAMLAEIEAREQAATKGKWRWRVAPKSKYALLVTMKSDIVLDFVRAGMNGAMVRFNVKGLMEPAHSLNKPIPGQEHHKHWDSTIDHPDADFIAHARADIPALIALVRTLAKRRAVICSRCGGTAQVVDEHGRPCGQTVHTIPCPDCTTGATWEDGV